jgi:ADP-ribose pyrophosphatase YjhB (NUDIX family)
MTGVGGDELLGSVVSAADVARRLASLEERFGSFPLRKAARENDAAFFGEGVERALGGGRGAAGGLVTALAARVLLVRHAADPDAWGTPGGGHEAGESFAATARREVREETGVDPALVGVHEAVRTEVAHEADAERTFTMLTVHFEGVVGAAEPALEVSDDEILEARWFEESPESLHDHCREWVEATLAEFDSNVDAAAHRTRECVDARIDGLRARYGDVPVREDRLVGGDDEFAAHAEAIRDDSRAGSAYALVARSGEDAPEVTESMPDEPDYDAARALLVRGRGEDEWTVPGGGATPGERFESAAEREVREETGVDCEVAGVHEVVRGVGERERDGRELHFVHVVFDARYVDGSIDVQERELDGACWFRDPPASSHWRVDAGLEGWFEAATGGEASDG